MRVEVEGILRYATPLLRRKNVPRFQAPPEAVMPSLRSTERRLLKDPEKAAAYCAEIKKLEDAGSVAKLPNKEMNLSEESWFIPHHMVQHNQKNVKSRSSHMHSHLTQGDSKGQLLFLMLK